MKKLISILFAVVLLLSGMHISMATHICGDEVAAVKWSVSHQLANCGMEISETLNHAGQTTVAPESCCKNEIVNFAVDSNYSGSSLQVNEPTVHLLQVLYIPEIVGLSGELTANNLHTNVQPPGKFLASAVDLPHICVFLI